jgi:hypothetical protein
VIPLTTRSAPAFYLCVLMAGPLAAQSGASIQVMGQAIGIVTRVDPIPGGGTLTEARLVQPVVMLHARALGGRLQAVGTLNLEGETIPDGELTPGSWGEGFNDRRHPHTYAHELMLTVAEQVGRSARIAVSGGKGFVPFGSDDPMSRPVLRYPVNHHLAQILERAVLIAGVRAGPVALEGALFNGDEPERPGQWPRGYRFGDSWAARLTLLPAAGVELSGSRAKVHSPEHRPGAGTDAWKWHVAARVERALAGGHLYALAEWARTEEGEGFFVFRSLLAEVAWLRGTHRPYYRFERSDRPEDLRTVNLFRSDRPHLENAILGTTRFTLHTIGYLHDRAFAAGRLRLQPFVEGTFGRMRTIDGGLLTPELLYGGTSVRSLAAGLRMSWRIGGHRMGRYGGLLAPGSAAEHGSHHD